MTIASMSFGRLGDISTRLLFGAASLAQATQAEVDHALEIVLQFGINHIDVAASYGKAELRLAPWLKRLPDQFFIATKTGQRTAQAGKEELYRSLDEMGIVFIPLFV